LREESTVLQPLENRGYGALRYPGRDDPDYSLTFMDVT